MYWFSVFFSTQKRVNCDKTDFASITTRQSILYIFHADQSLPTWQNDLNFDQNFLPPRGEANVPDLVGHPGQLSVGETIEPRNSDSLCHHLITHSCFDPDMVGTVWEMFLFAFQSYLCRICLYISFKYKCMTVFVASSSCRRNCWQLEVFVASFNLIPRFLWNCKKCPSTLF